MFSDVAVKIKYVRVDRKIDVLQKTADEITKSTNNKVTYNLYNFFLFLFAWFFLPWFMEVKDLVIL